MTYLNTSHVEVQDKKQLCNYGRQLHLNTSHVEVQEALIQTTVVYMENLNTSHVEVQDRRLGRWIDVNLI